MSRQKWFLQVLIISVIFELSSYAAVPPEAIWDKDGRYITPWSDMTTEYQTFALEKYKEEINYCSENFGKSFKEIDPKRVNSYIYEVDVGYITYGLIGEKYAAYGDYKKAAQYEYKDYLQYHNCEQKSLKTGVWFKEDCWPGAIGEGPVLGHVINTLEMNNDYKGVLPYYKIYLDDWVSRMEGKTYEEKHSILKQKAETDSEISRLYNDLMQAWEKAKKLAKTEKPKPLDPAVQNHEWFYSSKQKEVLKALGYYHANKVKFMLEKALKHKDPVIAAKAKGYLESLAKGTGHDTKH